MSNHYKFWIVLSFLVVFAAGIVSGVILDKYIFGPDTPKRTRSDRGGRSRVHFPTLNEMAEELELTDAQQEQFREIFKNNEERIHLMREEMNKQFHALRELFLEEIKSVLDPEQDQKFDAMIEWYREQRRLEMEKRKERASPSERKEGDSR